MRVIGIDPGSFSFDLFGIDVETGEIFIDSSIQTKRILKNPQILIEAIRAKEPFDVIMGPSGFGLPIKRLQELTEDEIFQMTLKKTDDFPTLGLTKTIEAFKYSNWNVFTLPGVKHLTTVPTFRKINKIDLGTADKLCTAVVGIKDLMEELDIPCQKTNFILIELGAAFSAVMAIKNGQIIDGIGGSNLIGFRASGALDGELGYLMGEISKEKIYTGGLSSIVGYEDLTPEEIILMAKQDERSVLALECFIDNIVKSVWSLFSSFGCQTPPQNILLSGRLSKNDFFVDELQKRLGNLAPVRRMKSYGQIAKRAAQGAAFIAEGLNGGPSTPIIDNLKLREATGHILDHIYIPLDPKWTHG